MYGLGRIPSKPDSRDFQVARLEALITTGQAVPMEWKNPVVLDQGQTPHCVGYGCAGYCGTAELNMGPRSVTGMDGERIYYEAKVYDGEPLKENGSSVRSGAKALLHKEGVINAYAFGSFDEAKAWVAAHGPVVIGIPWYQRMFYPSATGIIYVGGPVAGGHCLLWSGVHVKVGARYYNVLDNSWGTGWGVGGRCYITDASLKKLLAQQGEAMMAVRVK